MSLDQLSNPAIWIPLVRSRFFHEAAKLQMQTCYPEADEELLEQNPCQVVATHLAVSIAAELPQQLMHLSGKHLQSMGFDFDRALRIALRNFAEDRRKLPAGPQLVQRPEGFYVPPAGLASFASSLILYPELIQHLSLSGAPVLFMPHAAAFWVTGSEQVDLLKHLCRITLVEMHGQPKQPVTTIPMIFAGGQWRPWTPEPSHACYEEVMELKVRHEQLTYSAQTQLLKERNAAIGRDVHVARYRPARFKSGGGKATHLSISVWTESVVSELPKTDYVCLQRIRNREDLYQGRTSQPRFGESLLVPWEALQRGRTAPLPQQVYPERYLAEAFPDESEWQALRETDAIPPGKLAQALRGATQSTGSGAPRRVKWPALLAGGAAMLLAAFLLLGRLPLRNNFNQPPRFGPPGDLPLLPDGTPPKAKDFEVGELQAPQAEAFRDVLPMPPFAELPAEPPPRLPAANGELSPTGFAGGNDGEWILDRPPAGGVLVGLRLVKGREWGGAIRSVQPIYQVDQAYVLGARLGPDRGIDQIQYLARPGYVVGVVRVQAGLALNAIQLEFVPAAIDPPPEAAAYSTRWFGCVGGAPFQLAAGPFGGVDASVRGEIIGLQLQRLRP